MRMMVESQKTQAECWFLDVGQGTANVILLGEGRAIVVDCGPAVSKVTLKLLKRYVNTIEALIISHNHFDHDGGAADIVQAYPKAINQIYFIKDHTSELIRTWMVTKRESEKGNLVRRPLRLEASEKPQVLYSDRGRNITLRVLFPYFTDNIEADDAGKPNRTSAVLCLHCGKRSIVFSGDATIDAWECIASNLRVTLPARCDVMTIPHHGGKLSDDIKKHGEYSRRLYSEIILPCWGIISTGTTNQHQHPLPTTISALRESNVRVLCTQMTAQCSEELESIRPGVVRPIWPSRSAVSNRTTGSGRSKDVACVGTIVAEVSPEEVRVCMAEEFEKGLQRLAGFDTFHPLCRNG